MKTYFQYFILSICILAFSCTSDDPLDLANNVHEVSTIADCMDPATSDPISLELDLRDWIPESLTEQSYLLFRNADLDEILMPNCNLKTKTRTETYQYECDGVDYSIDYSYPFLQFISIGGTSNNFISSGATLSCEASYNHQTGQIEKINTVHLSGGNDEAAYIILKQDSDGKIDLEYGTAMEAVTINNTTFLEVYLNGTSLTDSDIVANAEDGIVAVKNNKDVWYTLADIN